MADTSKTAERLVADLMRELDLTREQAMGLVGNLAHESAGFNDLTENGVTVGRGGLGYAQWTGPRRTKFEAFAKANGLEPSSYEANRDFIVKEMRGPEKAALRRIKKATTTEQAATTAMNAYFRPGVPHLDSRKDWAGQFDRSITNDALSAINSAMMPGYQTQGGRGAFKPPTIDEVTAWDERGYRTPIQTSNFDRIAEKDPYGIGTLAQPYGPPKPPTAPVRIGSFSTETRYAPGAAKGAKITLTPSNVRATAEAKPIAGARRDGSGSVQYTAPPLPQALTTRSVPTIPILPGNTRVPTTPMEQLQLATERTAAAKRAAMVGTPQVASIAGATRSGSGSVTYSPPKVPVTASATAAARIAAPYAASASLSIGPQSSGIGGAGQVGTSRMAAAEPSVMKTIRPQLEAAMAAMPVAPKPTQAQLNAMRSVPAAPSRLSAPVPPSAMAAAMRDVSGIATHAYRPSNPNVKVAQIPGTSATELIGKDQSRLGYAPLPSLPPAGRFSNAAVDAINFTDLSKYMKPAPQVASVPMPRPRPVVAAPPKTVGALDLGFEPSEFSGQNMANSAGRTIKTPGGKVYTPMQGLGPPSIGAAPAPSRPGGLWGSLFSSSPGQPSVANSIMSGIGNATVSFGNPGYTTTPFQEDRFQTAPGATMPASMDNDRWKTGY